MKEITVCPSTLATGYSTFSKKARKTLFAGKEVSHILDIPHPSEKIKLREEVLRNVGHISMSGVQPKFSLVLDGKKLRYSKEGEQGEYILKPSPTGYHIHNKEFCAANEHLTMQLASQVYGIETAPNAVCFFNDEYSMAYITKRFDIENGEKFMQEDLAALMGFSKDRNGSDFKYTKGSYQECGEIIRKYVKAYLPDLRRFFNMVIFNFLTLNDDAHLKNFSLIEKDGEYRLSPAYDLINTSLHIWGTGIFALEKGLFKEGMELNDTRTVNRSDFVEFGKRLGLPENIVKKDIEMFLTQQPKAKELIENSFLSSELKKQYWDGYEFRRQMLTF